ncbi:MAG: Calreticulin family-domain-containing protein, partial [Olpidium bornovanus]
MRSSLTLVAAVVLGVAAVSAAVAEHQEGSPKAAAAGPEPADSAAKADEPRAEFNVSLGKGSAGKILEKTRPFTLAIRKLAFFAFVRAVYVFQKLCFISCLATQPSTRKALFVEQFLDDWDKRWSPSEATKKSGGEDSGNDPDLWRYRGRWAVEEATVYPGLKHDRGLVLKTAAAFHAISAPFAAPIDPAGKDLVVQYEVKMQQGLECGGAYLKLLQANDAKSFQAKDFTNETPYTLMFGPDKCGSTNKVHFIFHHKNPITGESEEKQLESPPFARTDKLSTLYTLIVRPDNTYEIRVNDDKVSSGSLLENFKPPVNPPKEVVDSNDTKPADWVDEAKIPDPDAKKPDDWDEDEPFEILDVDAKKPDDWYEDETETIPDPDAVKPHDWNDEEDGEWVPPTILNPKCEKAAGCGKWSTPMKRNPLYKGKWKPPMIDNPAYKGVWKPRMIPNPGYFEDRNPANLSKMVRIFCLLFLLSFVCFQIFATS